MSAFSAVTNLRNTVFDKVQKQGAEFFEAQSTGRLMSSIMNDIDKVQVAISHILADLLRQFFTAIVLVLVVVGKDWRLALLSLIILPLSSCRRANRDAASAAPAAARRKSRAS